jgi:hypothetical protein
MLAAGGPMLHPSSLKMVPHVSIMQELLINSFPQLLQITHYSFGKLENGYAVSSLSAKFRVPKLFINHFFLAGKVRQYVSQ